MYYDPLQHKRVELFNANVHVVLHIALVVLKKKVEIRSTISSSDGAMTDTCRQVRTNFPSLVNRNDYTLYIICARHYMATQRFYSSMSSIMLCRKLRKLNIMFKSYLVVIMLRSFCKN